MFKLTQTPTFFWPVEVQVIVDGGRYEKQTFDAEFTRLSQSEMVDLQKKLEAGEMPASDFVGRILVGWRGIADGSGEVPFSAAALDQLLERPGLAALIIMAYSKAHTGIIRKN